MNVPQLRFSGFEGEWETFELKKLVKLEGGATPLKSEKRYWQDGHIPWVSSQEVGPKKLDKTTFNITEAAVSETSTKMVDKATLLLVVRSGILVRKIPLSITAVPMAINQDIKAMVIKDDRLHHLFLYQWMKKNEKAMLSNVVKGGTTVQSVNTPDLQDYLLGIPSINEQLKIVEFFELIDGKIEKLQEKIVKLGQFKKGMMQKIFSQELRFKDEDGGEFPEWEETTLGNLAEINTGNKDLQDAKENGIYPFFVRSQKLQTIDTYSYDGEAILIPGDGNIGQIFHYINGKFNFHQRVYKISDFKNEVKGKYIYYYLREYFLKEALKNSVKATVDSLRLPTIKGMHIKLPHMDEQIKIVQILTDIERKIEKEKEKLMVLEEQKKGFMWGMFV